MSLFLEIKYLRMVSSRLTRFKEKRSNPFVASCKCWVCGDSKKESKTRGNFFEKDNSIFYHCYNCNINLNYYQFLKDFDANLFKEWSLESFKEKTDANKMDYIPTKHVPETKKYIPDIFEGLPEINSLSDDHPAKKILLDRKIPLKHKFYYAENFIEWTKTNNDKFEKWKGSDHPRIIIPWYSREGTIIGYSARSMRSEDTPKYIRIFVDDNVKEKFYGMDRLDDTKTHFVVEGEFDSLCIPNAIAVSNGKLHTYTHKNAVMIGDIDIRNPQIMKNTSDMIDLGLKVCLLPTNLGGKDLNELVMLGYTQRQLVDLIEKNTFQGLKAKIKFNLWKNV